MAPALSDILRITSSLLVLLLLMFCMGAIILEAQDLSLAPDEVGALLEVATQLGKKGWNRNMQLCNDTILPTEPDADNKVVCNCSFPGGACHVVAIYLKRQDLDGTLPKAIEKLPHLKHLDLWANYLSGKIPSEWANTKLEYLSIGVNNLAGKIPSYLGRITTLSYLNIQNNMFSGTVPPELGGLVNLENLTLSANNLTGELPPALINLTGLKELRLSSNNFTGRIPDFIQSWKQLDTLEIQAGGFTGPIPLNISVLTTLTDLKISNLLGNGSEFPNLESIKGIKYLDLSFNRLNGSLPTNFDGLEGLEKMKPVECLSACLEEQYSVHINCGGPEATIGNTIYKADDEPGGAVKYVPKREEDWQISTTGHFWDIDSSLDNYIAQNKSMLRMDDSVLYTNARLTPLSLTYYVRCLGNGNYKVKLHFAEIVMRDNRSYYSLGRRIFDVYIQDIVVLKDFDIVKEAGGVDKVYIHNFTAPVTNGALEIRLHWAGKGTTTSPKKGIYGPLISAIDVESDFKPPHKGSRKRFIVAGAVGVLSDGTPIAVKQLSAKSKQGNREGYMAPEYALYGYLTYKADVYSFGVVALEIVSGMNNVKFRRDENFVCLLDWVLYLQKNGDIMEIVDPRLGSEFNKKEVVRMINVALLCTNQSPALRPTMSTVVSMLEGKTDVEELVMVPSTLGDPSGYATALHKKFAQSSVNGSLSETQSLVKSSEGPWTASSSSSAQDLYPISKS
uniref:non-specific serine/threonine protein kinase n=1 Tax=Populus alba TaxID=43335 RepID=A0A4U5Q6Q8_POPAL|nr:putative leucine-rich repeat receptor-like serine/threonine-protein kinase [Populus alba]